VIAGVALDRANQRLLAAAFAWLRLRLDRHERPDGPAEAALDPAEATLADALAAEPPAPLLVLARRLALSTFELQLVLLCLGAELDPDIAEAVARLQGGLVPGFPSVGLALSLLDGPAWQAFAPDRPLRSFPVLEPLRHAGPHVQQPLRLDERARNFLLGIDHLDERLVAHVRRDDPGEADDDDDPPGSHAAALTRVRERLADGAVIQLVGPDPAGGLSLVRAAARHLGRELCVLAGDALPTSAADLDALARLWAREATLSGRLLLVEGRSAERAGEASLGGLVRLLRRLRGGVVVDLRAPLDELERPIVELGKPTAAEQRAAWQAMGLPADAAATLAATFHLGAPALRRLAGEAADPSGEVDAQAVRGACLQHGRTALASLAQRIPVTARWADLVLPPTELRLLRQLADQARHRTQVHESWGFGGRSGRGLGITALFAGPSGTGKTFATEVLAGELGLELVRVELPAIVSKFIGETEKNLRRLFDAAEDSGAVLLFDEADALFGKRSEVKDSHDRYANLEVSYLLQRMESYRGVAVLATNFRGALDPALIRRLRFVVQFPFPGLAERAAIWRRAFPPQAAAQALDWAALARLNLTGGHIQTIAVNAAFLASAAGSAIAMTHVLEATRAELRKLERPAHEVDALFPAGAAA